MMPEEMPTIWKLKSFEITDEPFPVFLDDSLSYFGRGWSIGIGQTVFLGKGGK
jgi:hypothetical protein